MLWKELGGTLAKGVKNGRVPAGLAPVVWRDSETLADTIRQINKQSNNVMERTLLLTLGADKLGPGAPPQTDGADLLAVLKSQGRRKGGSERENAEGESRSGQNG